MQLAEWHSYENCRYFWAAALLNLAVAPLATQNGTTEPLVKLILGYDINCKFMPYLRVCIFSKKKKSAWDLYSLLTSKLVQNHFPDLAPLIAKAIIPSMHLYSHRFECFETFNPTYTKFAGDFSFEAIESFWSAQSRVIPIIRRASFFEFQMLISKLGIH